MIASANTPKKRIAIAIAIAVALPFIAQFGVVEKANATMPVVEVGPNQLWNLISQIENTATAAQTLESYKQQLTDSVNNFTQLQQLPQSLINSGMSLNDLNVYQFHVSQLLGSVQNMQQLETNLQQQYSVSGATSWDQFYANQQAGVANGDALATQNYQRARQIQGDIQTQYDQINKNQAAVSAITGTQSGFQAVASQLQLLTKQNAQMLEMLSAKQVNEGVKGKTDALEAQQTASENQKKLKDIQDQERTNLQKLRAMNPGLADKFTQP